VTFSYKGKTGDWNGMKFSLAMMFMHDYPSIPINKALELVEGLLRENKTLKKVTELSVDSIM
jgi:hypothetical protein